MDEQMNTDQQPMPDQIGDDSATTEPEMRPIDTPEDPVEEQSEESFPASDPPSFTGSTTE